MIPGRSVGFRRNGVSSLEDKNKQDSVTRHVIVANVLVKH